MIRAAGGVIARERDGVAEVVVVHRPAYDDWTLPKGKAKKGESDEDCAVREVEEETGLRCTRGRELESVLYLDSTGRPKVVRYWLMQADGGELRPEREIDDVRWVSYGDAERLLSYERDRVVLRSAALA
jgi:8-oxo-dGTP diphosphatase